MIPREAIAEWRVKTPWAYDWQVEQDLVIARALVAIYADDVLRTALAFRGGTALHKLYFDPPERYSEDIDLVQVTGGPIGPVLDRLRAVLAWLGKASFDRNEKVTTLTFRFPAEGALAHDLGLKVEINTREHFALDGWQQVRHRVQSRWFQGSADITTFTFEELLSTKLRGLFQRSKGRDAFDLARALEHPARPVPARIVGHFQVYMEREGKRVTRAQFEENLEGKRRDTAFLNEIHAFIANNNAEPRYDAERGLDRVISDLVALLPGSPWSGSVPDRRGLLATPSAPEQSPTDPAPPPAPSPASPDASLQPDARPPTSPCE